MKRVISDSDSMRIELCKLILENEGIRTNIRNYYSCSLMGALPFSEVWPELWVNDEDFEKAVNILKDGKEYCETNESVPTIDSGTEGNASEK